MKKAISRKFYYRSFRRTATKNKKNPGCDVGKKMEMKLKRGDYFKDVFDIFISKTIKYQTYTYGEINKRRSV